MRWARRGRQGGSAPGDDPHVGVAGPDFLSPASGALGRDLVGPMADGREVPGTRGRITKSALQTRY